MEKPCVGYYSHEQAELGGCCVYKNPDGKQVRVTEVVLADAADGGPAHASIFKDSVFVGPVTEMLYRIPEETFQVLWLE